MTQPRGCGCSGRVKNVRKVRWRTQRLGMPRERTNPVHSSEPTSARVAAARSSTATKARKPSGRRDAAFAPRKGVAREANARARNACAARYKSGSWQRAANLRRRRHTRAPTAKRDEPAGRIAPKNSSLLPVSAQSERLATSSFRNCWGFVHRRRRSRPLSA